MKIVPLMVISLTGKTMFDKLNSILKITGISYQVLDAQIIISGKGCSVKTMKCIFRTNLLITMLKGF